ncbi:hypothetical protein lerEdw1_005044 [Lerista edwardsae]|nr:hypothetical protein lerEdw1_005044 [Lerista edwardsae]
MASRLLHRLRHTLTGEVGQEGLAGCSPETEDFPESSELEDDTEGLSTRLSGTLSFTSNEEDGQTEDEGDAPAARPEAGGPLEPGTPGDATESGEPSAVPAERWGSNMLTRQLQELWRKSRSSLAPQRLLFEVTSTSVVSERNSKYVRLRRNFAAETIAKRSRAFEQLLGRLHAVPEIRRSEEYLHFFFLGDLRGAQQLTGRGRYQEALLAWTNARRLQEKLGACRSRHFLLTLAGLAVCQQELARPGEAHAACEQALQLLEAQDRHPLLLPFLHAHLHLAQRLGKDRRPAEAWLRALEEAGGAGAGAQPPSLKEHLLQQPLP